MTAPLRSCDVYPDGQHFIMARLDDLPDQHVTRLNVVLNWLEELNARMIGNLLRHAGANRFRAPPRAAA